MMGKNVLFYLIGIFLFFLGFYLKSFLDKRKKEKAEFDIDRMFLNAEKKTLEMIEKAKEKKDEIIKKAEGEIKEKFNELFQEKKNIEERQKKIDEAHRQVLILDQKLRDDREELENQKIYLKQKIDEEIQELEKISFLDRNEAKNKLFKKIEDQYSEDLFLALKRFQKEKKKQVEEKAREVLAMAIQKYSGEVNHSLVTTVVELKNDDEKGKVIGRDGRNIRTFERVTGVQLIIDDSPEIITISSFDPVRREVASRVLNRILDDGIVQPAKIEEYYEISAKEVEDILYQKGLEALDSLQVYGLDDELIKILGRLHFRTSFGQNVLQHSIEVANIAKTIASQIGANENVAKISGLFHDIGKALDHEEEGSHVEIGRRILKKFDISDEIIKSMETHHREYLNETIESYIVDAADKISASRPGARSGSAENYLKKLEGLERITSEFEGVNEAYALSAGREIRVFVKPDEVNDYLAQKMAREIAMKIEEELQYPGEIKVAVIREKRVIEYAK